MISILARRSLGWGGICFSTIMVCWHFLFPYARTTYHYSRIYGNAFIDSAPSIIFKDKKIEFVGADSVTVPMEKGMKFIFNSTCDSMILIDKVPGSVAVSHDNIFLRLEKRVLVMAYGPVNIESVHGPIPPGRIRHAILKYGGLVIVILSLIAFGLIFLCFLLLSLISAGVCSIIDTMVETTLNFSIFFHLSGIILFLCTGSFLVSGMDFHQAGIMILTFFLIMIVSCFLLIKQNVKPQITR
jgi:hypothetical protein